MDYVKKKKKNEIPTVPDMKKVIVIPVKEGNYFNNKKTFYSTIHTNRM